MTVTPPRGQEGTTPPPVTHRSGPHLRAVAPVPVPFVDLAAQHAEVRHDVEAGIGAVMAATAFVNGADVSRFEEEWARYCGLARSVGVASGTDAVELALRACGIGAGDEVILPANTFIATAEAVVRAGARPALVDCDRHHLLIDPAAVAAAVTHRTRAVVPVHLFGQMAPMDLLSALAGRFGLPVVEDAAQAHGATHKGRGPGHWGRAAATSFYPGKNLGAYGDAGAVMTDHGEVADAVGALRNHGSHIRYEHPVLGFNSRLDTMQAVVLRAKLSRLDAWNEARRRAARIYGDLLDGVDGVETPEVADGNVHVWHLYVVQVDDRDRVARDMEAAGIQVGVHYPVPVHLTGAFRHLGYGPGAFPVAERAAGRILSLPMHPHLSPADQSRVVEALARAVA